MTKKVHFILLILTVLILCTGFTYAAAKPITIMLDGKQVKTDTDPVIQSGRTLVPVAVIVQNMGGAAEWDGSTREVTIVCNGTTIKLKINEKDAYINGEKTVLDVPATIINNRTIVPLRFISEALQYEVGYDETNRQVLIDSPVMAKQNINEISMLPAEGACRIEVKGTQPFAAYTTMTLTGPDRFVLDMKKAALIAQNVEGLVDSELVAAVRMSQFTTEDTRIVIDLKKTDIAAKVSVSEDKKSIYLDFGDTAVLSPEINRGDIDRDQYPADTSNSNSDDDPAVLPADGSLLVVLDPGHGGSDPGALGKESGKAVLNEKDLNLEISLRIRDKLEAAGVNVYMTRETDKAVILASRPAIANEVNGALFVSIHNNSSESAAIKGMEILYYNKETDNLYGFGSSYEIATIVGNHMKKEMGPLGLTFNKYVERPGLAVLNKTSMPSILVEGAYLSNQSDRSIMKTDAFMEKYATSVANAIIELIGNRSR